MRPSTCDVPVHVHVHVKVHDQVNVNVNETVAASLAARISESGYNTDVHWDLSSMKPEERVMERERRRC